MAHRGQRGRAGPRLDHRPPEEKRGARGSRRARGDARRATGGPARTARARATPRSHDRRTTTQPTGRMRERTPQRAAAGSQASERSATCVAGAGRPRSSGASGAPSQSRGGATIIRRRCWIMWAVSDSAARASSGGRQGHEEHVESGHEGSELAPAESMRHPAAQPHPAARVDARGQDQEATVSGIERPRALARPHGPRFGRPQRSARGGGTGERAAASWGERNVSRKATRAVTSAGERFLP